MTATLRLLIALFVVTSVCLADEITLDSNLDTTIFEELRSSGNAQGDFLFSGATANRNGGASRRALFSFDIAAGVPANAVITDASLSLRVDRVPPQAVTNDFAIHRVEQAWTEGTSNAPGREGRGGPASDIDTTWTGTGNGSWTNPGGDFSETISSSTSVGARGTYTWEATDFMLADINMWLNDPSTNFGWILIGDEDTPKTAKRFISGNNSASGGPSLTLTFEVDDPGIPGDYDGDGTLTPADVDLLCEGVRSGDNPAEFDLDQNMVVDLEDQRIWVEDLAGTFRGDVDLNGVIDFPDFLNLSGNFGIPPQPGQGHWAVGDFNCDANVDFPDFLELSGNFGRTSQAVASVPEPASQWMVLGALFALLTIRRRRLSALSA